MLINGIHHVRFAVLHPHKVAKLFIDNFKFVPYATEDSKTADKAIALKHQDVIFVICKRNKLEITENSLIDTNLNYDVDTVCDIAFDAKNIRPGSNVKQVSNKHGFIKYKCIPSIVGNLQHTIIDQSHYSGYFLPGFTQINTQEISESTNYFFNIDHIAFAAAQGFTADILNWYQEIFEFERLYINENDDEENGFVVQSGDMGLRLRAMQQTQFKQLPLKFVIAESTSSKNTNSDQINEFIQSHKGMGVQHIGLGTTDILKAVHNLRQEGASFILPPIEYYENIEKRRQITGLELPLKSIQEEGIMVESNKICNVDDYLHEYTPDTEKWFILQVFTRPIFSEKTFFMELIQRHKTEAGFGAGNIQALWQSLQSHMNNNTIKTY